MIFECFEKKRGARNRIVGAALRNGSGTTKLMESLDENTSE
jgi:hypothetical protein